MIALILFIVLLTLCNGNYQQRPSYHPLHRHDFSMDIRDGRHGYSYQYGRPEYNNVRLRFDSTPAYYPSSYKNGPAHYDNRQLSAPSHSNYAGRPSSEPVARLISNTLYRDQTQPSSYKSQTYYQPRYTQQQQNHRYQFDVNDDGYRYRTLSDYGSDVYVYYQSKSIPGSQRLSYIRNHYNQPAAYNQPYTETTASPNYNDDKYSVKFNQRPYDYNVENAQPQLDIRVATSRVPNYAQNKPQFTANAYPQNQYNDKSQSYNYAQPQNNYQRQRFSYSYITSHPARQYYSQPYSAHNYGGIYQRQYHNNDYRQQSYAPTPTYNKGDNNEFNSQIDVRSREYLASPVTYNVQSRPLAQNYATTSYNNHFYHTQPQYMNRQYMPYHGNAKYASNAYYEKPQVQIRNYAPLANNKYENVNNYNADKEHKAQYTLSYGNNANYDKSQPQVQNFEAISHNGGYSNHYRQSQPVYVQNTQRYGSYSGGANVNYVKPKIQPQNYETISYDDDNYKGSQQGRGPYSQNYNDYTSKANVNYGNNQNEVRYQQYSASPLNNNYAKPHTQTQNYESLTNIDDDRNSNAHYNSQIDVRHQAHSALPVNGYIESPPQSPNYATTLNTDVDDDKHGIDVRFKENSRPIYNVKSSGESYSYKTPSSQLYHSQNNPSYRGAPIYVPPSTYSQASYAPSRIRYDSPSTMKSYNNNHHVLREFLHEQRDGYFGYSYDVGGPGSNVVVKMSSSVPSNYLYKRQVGSESRDSYISRRSDRLAVEAQGDLSASHSSITETKIKVEPLQNSTIKPSPNSTIKSSPNLSTVAESRIEVSTLANVENGTSKSIIETTPIVIEKLDSKTLESRIEMLRSLEGDEESVERKVEFLNSPTGGLNRPADGPQSTVGKPFVLIRDSSLPDDKGRHEYKLPELTNIHTKMIHPTENEGLFRDLYATHPDIHGLINPSRHQQLNVIGLPHKFRFQHPQGNVNGFRPFIYEGNAYLNGPNVDINVRRGSGQFNDAYKFKRIYDTHPGTDRLVNPDRNGPLNVIGLPYQFRYPHPNGHVNGFRPPEVPTNKYLAAPAVDHIVDKPLLPKVVLPTDIYAATGGSGASYMNPSGTGPYHGRYKRQVSSLHSPSDHKQDQLPLARYSQGPVNYVRNSMSKVKPPQPAQTISYNHPMLQTYIAKAKSSFHLTNASTKPFIYTRPKLKP